MRRWLKRLGVVGLGVLVVVVIIAAVIAFGARSGEDEEAIPTTTTAAPGAVDAPVSGGATDPRIACAQALPPRQQVGQLVGISVNGSLPDMEAARVAGLGVGLVLLQHPSNDRPVARIQALKDASAIPPLVAVDEEGGAVQDLREILGPFPSEERMARDTGPREAHDLVLTHARSMATLGIDVVFAPVVDVAPANGVDPLGDDRIFSSDPATVTAYGQAYVDAYREAGILPTLKHFPGHGAATANTHEGAAGVPPLAQLRTRDLLPYDELLDDGVAVLVGHLVVPDVTFFAPATLSSGIMQDLLRDEYGFDGLIVTDSLSMGAVAGLGPPEEVALEAIRAGADIALFNTLPDPAAVIDRLARALERGTLDAGQVATSVVRVLDVKGVDPCEL